MTFVWMAIVYIALIAFLIRFFQCVHEWDEQIRAHGAQTVRRKRGMFRVTTLAELEEAKKHNPIWVLAVCHKCGGEFTSIPLNAANVIEHGCLLCTDAWDPVAVMFNLHTGESFPI